MREAYSCTVVYTCFSSGKKHWHKNSTNVKTIDLSCSIELMSKAVVEMLFHHSIYAARLHKSQYVLYQYKTICSRPLLALSITHQKENCKRLKAKGERTMCNIIINKKTLLQFMEQWKREMEEKKGKEGDHQFISIWIMAQESNAIKWERLFSRGVLRSLRQPQISSLDTVFVTRPGDKGKDICWHLLSAAGSKWQMAFGAAGY